MSKARTDVVDAIRLVWDSLDSHLDSTQGLEELKECCKKAVGSPNFHKKCVKEYAEIIKTLAATL